MMVTESVWKWLREGGALGCDDLVRTRQNRDNLVTTYDNLRKVAMRVSIGVVTTLQPFLINFQYE